jgi:hypothetical protein
MAANTFFDSVGLACTSKQTKKKKKREREKYKKIIISLTKIKKTNN